VRPDGSFVFHVNALEERSLRECQRVRAQERESNYVLEQSGQTVHFFSDDCLQELLQPCREVHLEPVESAHPSARDRSPIAARGRSTDAGEPFTRIWRGSARRYFAGHEAGPTLSTRGASGDGGVLSASSSRGFWSQASQSPTSYFHAFGLLACSRASPRVRADCAHRTDSSATAAMSAAPSAYAATVFLVYQMGSYIDGMGPSWPMSL
jgi:hypothetical protein